MKSGSTRILGISAFYHDSAAALVVDGEIVAAIQEERFTREKFDASFPSRSVDYCLREAGLTADQLDYITFYDKPLVKFERLLETYLAFAPEGLRSFNMAMPVWLKKKLFMRGMIRRGVSASPRTPLVFLDHHESHAASAFFPSPFDEAAILTLDGVGEWSTATCGLGQGNTIKLTKHLQFPHSLGLLYSAFTYYTGFKVNSGEYKLMGLAPYGQPVYRDAIYKHLVDVRPDGSLWLNTDYFNYCQGLTMTNGRFDALFGGSPRQPDSPLERRHMDLASSIQVVTEEIIMKMARALHEETRAKNLVLAGGVALNCVANGRLRREGPFDSIWVQPAAGDAGGALGAAMFVWHQLLEKPRSPCPEDAMKGSLLGPVYSTNDVAAFLRRTGATFRRMDSEADLLAHTAQALADEKVVGWFQGRMEFGPRALGSRSILGDPRSARMQATMNVKIKFRESFRPFAPSVLREHAHEWFAVCEDEASPYMLMVSPVLECRRTALSPEDGETLRNDPDLVRRVNIVRSALPAITHVDYSARLQTVDERHGRYHRLLKEFYRLTGCPVLVNTSFNLSWEPIVNTPDEAYRAFMQSEMDMLVLEDYVLEKATQPLGVRPWSTDGRVDANSPWADPLTGDGLVVTPDGALNPVTGTCYPVEEGIPRLFVPTDGSEYTEDVTETVKAFYEETPFPNYDDLDNPRALLEKARAGLFARLLNDQIPYDARVVEVGCGTGQLTNFLAIAHRSVIGVDICLNSLRLASRFRTEHGIERATFAQSNPFRPALRDGFFDFVISNGVRNHTADARRAFQRISRLARPGGYVIMELYNAYSRKLHAARRSVSRWTGLNGGRLDPHFGEVGAKDSHRHETCYTLSQVFDWLAESGLEFINSIPKPEPGFTLETDEQLFVPRSPGTSIGRVLSQVAAIGNGHYVGGSFIVIARRPKESQ